MSKISRLTVIPSHCQYCVLESIWSYCTSKSIDTRASISSTSTLSPFHRSNFLTCSFHMNIISISYLYNLQPDSSQNHTITLDEKTKSHSTALCQQPFLPPQVLHYKARLLHNDTSAVLVADFNWIPCNVELIKDKYIFISAYTPPIHLM